MLKRIGLTRSTNERGIMLPQRLIVGTIVAVLANGAFASSAAASAEGAASFNEGTVDTPKGSYDIPRGALDHGVSGEGLEVESQKASFSSATPICNWSVRYSHFDLSGNEYRSKETPIQYECDIGTRVPGVEWEGKAKPGTACAILKKGTAEGSVEIARQCHNVTKNDSWPVW